jgi:hypothetical protein
MAVKTFKSLLISISRLSLSFIFSRQLMKIVRIEGGLGSQIIGMVIYESKKMKDPSIRPDVSYFSQKNHAEKSNGPTIWSWQLDLYGYPLENLFKQARFYDRYLGVLFSSNSRKIKDSTSELAVVPWRSFARKLPLAEGLNSFLEKYDLSSEKDFAVIHVRRGDYLKVASRVLTLEESIEGFARFSSLTSSPIFITSDEILSKKDFDYCAEHLKSAPLIVVDPSTDLHIVHSLMRSASFLFTSNSTFSWTAGMLNVRDAPMIISPTSFFGEKDHQFNDLFRARSSWMVLDID